jgi:hypothetical protein
MLKRTLTVMRQQSLTTKINRVFVPSSPFTTAKPRLYNTHNQNSNSSTGKILTYGFGALMGGSLLYQIYKSIMEEEDRNRARNDTEARIYKYMKQLKEYPVVYSIIGANVAMLAIGSLFPAFAYRHLHLSLFNIAEGRLHKYVCI